MLGSSNPTLTPEIFEASADGRTLVAGKKVMTIQGTVTASMVLGGICAATAVIGWSLVSANMALVLPIFFATLVVGMILALLMVFKPVTAPYASPLYAAVQGVWVGAASLLYSQMAAGSKLGGATGSGIVLQAGILTFGVLFGMLFLYKARIIKATGKVVGGIMAATMGVGLLYLTVMIMNMFGGNTSWFYTGWIAIAISGVVVVVASMNLIIDFDVIESGADAGAPRYMEWYAAFGLLVTVIWIYLSILRLLALLNRRD